MAGVLFRLFDHRPVMGAWIDLEAVAGGALEGFGDAGLGDVATAEIDHAGAGLGDRGDVVAGSGIVKLENDVGF